LKKGIKEDVADGCEYKIQNEVLALAEHIKLLSDSVTACLTVV